MLFRSTSTSKELKGDRELYSESASKELKGGKELQGVHLGGAEVRQGDRDGHLRQRPRQEEGDEGDEGDQRDGGEQARDHDVYGEIKGVISDMFSKLDAKIREVGDDGVMGEEAMKAMKVVKSAADGELKAMKAILDRRPKVDLSSDSDDWG